MFGSKKKKKKEIVSAVVTELKPLQQRVYCGECKHSTQGIKDKWFCELTAVNVSNHYFSREFRTATLCMDKNNNNRCKDFEAKK